MRLTSLIAFSALALVACRGGDDDGNNNGNPDGGNGSGSGSGGFVKIQDVQNDSMSPGTAVSLHNVVVTAIDNYGSKKGDIWVEEQGGGKRSGVHVYNASLTDVAALHVGDVIDLKGAIKAEFALTGSNADSTGRTETELEPASGGQITITPSGMTAAITPDKVDAFAIQQLWDSTMAMQGGGTAFTNAWEDWEGVLVELDNVAAEGDAACVGNQCTDPTLQKFDITGHAVVESSVAAFANSSSVTAGYCYASMTGVVSYFYDYLIYPRSDADQTGGGTACHIEAATGANNTDGTACTDGIDNDQNGYIDCADLGCSSGAHAWLGADGCQAADATCGCSKNYVAGSAGSINTDFATTSGAAYLRNVYVTGFNTASKGFWVSDSLTQAAGHSAFVFTGSGTIDPSITVGKMLATVQGTVGPYPTTGTGQKIVELSHATIGTVSAGGTIVPLTGVALDTLSSLTNGAQYYGVVVTVGPVTLGANGVHNQIPLTSGGKTLVMDDDAFYGYGGGMAATPPAAGCYKITGVMGLQTTDQVRTINPRSAADIVTATGC